MNIHIKYIIKAHMRHSYTILFSKFILTVKELIEKFKKLFRYLSSQETDTLQGEMLHKSY